MRKCQVPLHDCNPVPEAASVSFLSRTLCSHVARRAPGHVEANPPGGAAQLRKLEFRGLKKILVGTA